jgi:uncharacterized protein affecting Mg2+/Co2+ transport
LSITEGDGVIGLYPIVKAGASPFNYQSCSRQKAPGGAMGGWFVMQYQTGETFNLIVPRFEFTLPCTAM